ncbi:MAG: DNA-binding protein [Candidatus Thiodiazotropha endolucinida]
MTVSTLKVSESVRTPEEVRQEFAVRGIAISEWARRMGYSPGLVHQVLAGRLRCVRGQAHEVAVVLGLKVGQVGGIGDLPFGQENQEIKKIDETMR